MFHWFFVLKEINLFYSLKSKCKGIFEKITNYEKSVA